MFICDRETGAKQFRGLVMSEIHRRRPRRYNFEFSFVGNDRRPSQKSGTRRENSETFQILQICPRPSQTNGDIYDLEFSLVGKIWDSRETVKFPIVWDFPDIWAFDDFKKWDGLSLSCMHHASIPAYMLNDFYFCPKLASNYNIVKKL